MGNFKRSSAFCVSVLKLDTAACAADLGVLPITVIGSEEDVDGVGDDEPDVLVPVTISAIPAVVMPSPPLVFAVGVPSAPLAVLPLLEL